jgi:hypothetical protein
MPEVTEQRAGTAGLATPIRVGGVFDDPGVIHRLVQRNGPPPGRGRTRPPPRSAKACCPISGRPGRQAATSWRKGAEVILHNPALRATSQLTGTSSHNAAICAATGADNT